MNAYEAQMMMQQLSPEDQKLLAAQMGNRASDGGALSTSTIGAVADQGRLMQTEAQTQAQGVGLQNYRKANLAQNERDSQRRSETARGVLGFAKPSNRATEKFEDSASLVGNIRDMTAGFRDEFTASGPLTGGLEEWAGRHKYIPSSQDQDDMSNWWGNWKGHYENIQRNKLFGSALTDSEKAEWRKANINSDMAPKDIRQRMNVLNRLNDKMAAYAARNAINKQWDPKYVRDVYDTVIPDEAFESRENLDAYVDSTREGFKESVGESSQGEVVLEDMTLQQLLELKKQRGL